MSVQFGRWNFDGKPIDREYLDKVRPMIAPYGPDESHSYVRPGIGILYHAFHTTKESRCETQPHLSESGSVITWDGRLDNRAELIRQLRTALTINATDVSIVAAAYEEWGTDCFAKLIGDWALSVWDSNSRSLILAKDPIGTRHLYYSVEKKQIVWSTILDPLVLLAQHSLSLCSEYVAGWFASFPDPSLTPYVGIHSVAPSSFEIVRAGRWTSGKYWDFDPVKKIRYRTDKEYEEHFRTVFSEAVRRRLRAETPILAELSGGMDSSSIVCMADDVISGGFAANPRLDTVSYYNDLEPNWNERPYFTKVEARRGRTGTHIDVGDQESLEIAIDSGCLAATPSSIKRPVSDSERRFAACLVSQGHRIVLSGIGGDEVTGGVPTAMPELEDLLATGQFRVLARQLKAWSLKKRKPWFHLFFEAARSFFPSSVVGVPNNRRPAMWLYSRFIRQNRIALRGYQSRVSLFGALPTFQENLSALDALRRQLGCCPPVIDPPYEKRYPFLDRDLLEFMYSIPREQIVRPGERRSLMRRALAGIVPDEILCRKRKAYIARGPMASIATEWSRYVSLTKNMISNDLGIVDHTKLLQTLEKARQGKEIPTIPLLRTLGVEVWLRNLSAHRIAIATEENRSRISKDWKYVEASAGKN